MTCLLNLVSQRNYIHFLSACFPLVIFGSFCSLHLAVKSVIYSFIRIGGPAGKKMPLVQRGDSVSVPLLGNRDFAAKIMEMRAGGQKPTCCGNGVTK